MREKAWYPVLYMFLVTAAFSTALIVFARMTEARVDANERIAFERAVLTALDIPGVADMGPVEIHRFFSDNITSNNAPLSGAMIYRTDRGVTYALPFHGQGFWAPIHGILGIESDTHTLSGLAVYEQNETPGLGAEIAQPSFRTQFDGVKIATEGKCVRILTAAEGEPEKENEVAAVTGATQTSTRLEKMINARLDEWRAAVMNAAHARTATQTAR